MRVWVVLCVLTAVGATTAWADAAAVPAVPRLPVLEAPLRLTPDLAACLAVQRSTQVAISAEQVNAAQGALQEAEALRGIRVEGQASYTRGGPGTEFELPPELGGGSIEFAPTSTHRESLQVSIPLYLGGRDKYAAQAARAGVVAARENVDAAALDIALAARQTAYAVLRAEQPVVVAQQTVTAVAEHLRIARAMFEAGTVARFEVVQAETQLAEAQGNLIHTRTAVAQQKAVLAQTLVVPQGIEIIVEEGVPPVLPQGDLHGLIGAALEGRPELDVLAANVAAQEANLRLAQAHDNLSVAVQGQLNNQTETAAGAGFNWNVTVALSKPFYQGGEKQARVMQARSAVETARLNVERVQQQIALQVTQAQLGVEDAREALAVAEKGEAEAQERLRIAQVRFASGVSLGVEVLDAETALAAARTQVVNSRYNLQVATATLRAALGMIDVTKEPS